MPLSEIDDVYVIDISELKPSLKLNNLTYQHTFKLIILQ